MIWKLELLLYKNVKILTFAAEYYIECADNSLIKIVYDKYNHGIDKK